MKDQIKKEKKRLLYIKEERRLRRDLPFKGHNGSEFVMGDH